MKILLSDWAARHYSPAPSIGVLREWVKTGQLSATLRGGAYYVSEKAKRKLRPQDRCLTGGRIGHAGGMDRKPRGVLSAERRHQSALLRAKRLGRVAAWADLDKILAIHTEARRMTLETGTIHHVDHEIPLQGRLVSGLHVHNNLQVLTADVNRRKRNLFEIA